ncbi:MAG: VOC family protein, partial [Chloroflexota bacterium]
FEWPGAPKGKRGIGGTHHYALRVADYDGLLKWKRRLLDSDINVSGPFDRHYFKSIYFQDPDGVIIEIAMDGPGFGVDEETPGMEFKAPPDDMTRNNRDDERIAAEKWPEPVKTITADMALMHGMHHITAITHNIDRINGFYEGVLGLQRVKMTSNFDDPNSAHWYWGLDEGKPGSLITYFERDANHTRYSQMGAGHTHHFAFAVEDEETQLEWRERLIKAGQPVSPVQDRDYFKSIYTKDPNGHIVELATLGPGFAVDEPVESLGQELRIPKMHEHRRDFIVSNLKPLTVARWQKPEGER